MNEKRNDEPAWSSFFGGAALALILCVAVGAPLFYIDVGRIRCESVGGDWATIAGNRSCVHTTPVITPSPRP